MKQLKTVYIPTKVSEELPELLDGNMADHVFAIDKSGYKFIAKSISTDGGLKDEHDYPSYAQEWFKPTKIYVFTPEELKQLLEKYTDKIIRNVKLNKPDRYGRTTSETYYGEDGDVYVDTKSITSQLSNFLKEIGYE